ncbi:unnamed protein product [Lampetra fluviatilis]
MKRVEEELVFVSAAAASGFSTKERSFHRLIDYEDVDCLQHQVDTAHSEYLALRSQSVLKAQAYVLLNGLTTGAQPNARSPEEKEEHLTFMKSHLGSTICTEVSNVLRVHDGVPIDWNRLKEVGNKKVFVLSILGIQSSGKSTLLNAMFGLQFPVGAGRCTRGVYMRLVKVEEEFSTELGCDFVLIVDTEGLRASELSNAKPTRDNELATFVIGLGNATVINIFGENPSEMQDILQIAVQAFLRMRRVKLSPSCVFVHQNVGDVTAQDNNEDARGRLQEKLDEMTRLAAEQEQCAVESFDEVIRFDVDSHVRYFAHLWEGNPPMAPPNPSYCQHVKDLKGVLLSISKIGHNVLKMSEFKARIPDLWRALLTENFVFSFKNTLEIAAYSKLEEMYGKWTWSLRSHLIQEENQQYNIINNSTDVMSNLTRSKIEQSVLPKYNEIRKEIETYFKGDDDELLTQWKANFVKRFETIKEKLVTDTDKKCTDLIEQKSALNCVDQNRSRYEDQLMNKSKDLASKLKTTGLKDIQLMKEFNTMWEESMVEMKKSILAIKILNFRIQVQNILQQEFKMVKDISTKVEKLFNNESRVIQRNSLWNLLQFSHYQKEMNSFKKMIEDAENAANVVIKHIENRKLGCNVNNIHEVMKCVQATVDSFCKHNGKLKITNTTRLDLAIRIFINAEGKFQKIHDDFQRANDHLIYLSSKKEEYFNSFKIRCKGATNTTIFANTLCSKLKTAMHQAVCDKASLDIVDKMKSECQAFNGNRSKLENYILIHLAEKEMFKEFNEYLQKPQQYFVKYITERVEEYCSAKENDKIHEIFKSCLELYKKVVVNAIAGATTAVQTNNGDASSWLDEFSKRLGHKLNLPRHGLVIADYKDINDIAYLTDELTKAMETMVTQLNTHYYTASLRDLEHVWNKPHDMLCNQMSGCWVQCPFCNSLCTNTMLHHAEDHSTPFHRPHAVTGCKWHESKTHFTDICTSLVASDICCVLSDGKIIPYKEYRTIGREHASWSITPDLTVQPYWKWFVCRFKSDIEKLHSLQFKGSGAIPDGWTKITKDEAIADLRKK